MKTWRTRFKESLLSAPSSSVFHSALVVAFLIPVAAVIGQFASTGFFSREVPFLLLFWPGSDWEFAPRLPVWLTMGFMGASYLAGVAYLVRKKTFGIVVLSAIAALILAKVFAFAVNQATGWRELQTVASMSLTGKVNGLLFATWQNPLWEEVVFRGIPLLMLVPFRKENGTMAVWLRWSYILVPNIFLAIYHVPGHGYARLADTIVLGCAFSWITLRYSFFAPLVMHYILDAMIIISVDKFPNIPSGEIPWLIENKAWLNTSWSLAILAALVTLPMMAGWKVVRGVAEEKGRGAAVQQSQELAGDDQHHPW